ncbi:unnamed protein product [Staurois parvus]|uniref:Uncharacterized protein n=1 Tax=Staurois parvus TaxID=386267 RepID=A0ABN9F018_9NEOB|nr:unnamed protein product [Staurois parvus]
MPQDKAETTFRECSTLRRTQGRTDHLETRALPEGPGYPW